MVLKRQSRVFDENKIPLRVALAGAVVTHVVAMAVRLCKVVVRIQGDPILFALWAPETKETQTTFLLRNEPKSTQKNKNHKSYVKYVNMKLQDKLNKPLFALNILSLRKFH